VGIRHAVYPVPRHLKTALLEELLRGEGLTSAIVFTRTKRLADKLSNTLKNRGFKVSVLHGDRSQSQRGQALDNFRQGYSQVLVATDIAARGIDIEDISHVINFDIPGSPEDYVHRIGRTGRVDATGDAFSFVDKSEESMVKDIERALKQTLPRVTLPDFDYAKPAPPKPAHSYHPQHSFHHQRRGHDGHRR
jgi:ATP-dependent RNA helicase RhlE